MERRAFLTRSALVGLGLAASVSAAPTGKFAAACEARPSPADAMDVYEPLLGEIENEIIQGLVAGLVRASNRCVDLLRELRLKVDQLENELKTNKPRTQSVSGLTDAVDKQRVTATSPPDAVLANAVALGAVSQQARANVEDLLAPGNVLSPTAARLINEIVSIIKRSTSVEQVLIAEQTALTTKLNTLRGDIRSIRVRIADATLWVDRATHSGATAKDIIAAKDHAAGRLAGAVDLLLTKVKTSTDRPSALEKTQTLSLALNGIRAWVGALETISNREYALATRSVDFVHAGFAEAPNAAATSELGTLIEKNCGRGSAYKIQTVITAYLCVVSGLVHTGMVTNAREAKRDALLSLMRGTLVTNPVCDPDTARSSLADGLASLVP